MQTHFFLLFHVLSLGKKVKKKKEFLFLHLPFVISFSRSRAPHQSMLNFFPSAIGHLVKESDLLEFADICAIHHRSRGRDDEFAGVTNARTES